MSAERIEQMQRDLMRKYRVVGTYAGAAAAIAVVWTLYVLLAVYDIDLVGRRRSEVSRTNPRTLLIVACLATPLLIAWSIRSAKRIHSLATTGIRTTGRIESVGLLGRGGLRPMTISYKAGGTHWTVRKDLPRDHYAEGQEVIVLYDPNRPDRCEIQ